MTSNEMVAVINFERTLKPGQLVEARWTNSYMQYAAAATIVRANRSSIRVRLTEEIKHGDVVMYPIGREIVVPSMNDFRRWSPNNCVTAPAVTK
jgi:hypothetical protein